MEFLSPSEGCSSPRNALSGDERGEKSVVRRLQIFRLYLSMTTDLLPSAFVDLYIDERTCMSGELFSFICFICGKKG